MAYTVYIAGPMRGIKDLNFPAFDEAQARLIAAGFNAISPADLDREMGLSPDNILSLPPDVYQQFSENAITRDVEVIARECDAIVLLPGWQRSKGAAVEIALANFLGIPIWHDLFTFLIHVKPDEKSRHSPKHKPNSLPAEENVLEKEVAPESDVRKFETGAVRSKDADKTRYDLISPIGLRRVAEAYAEGATKYADFNWERGMPVSDILNHAIRHIFLYLSGDRQEDHLGHGAWNMLAACHSEELWPHLNKTKLRKEGCVPPDTH